MKDTKLLILGQKFDITDLRFHLLKMSVSKIRKLASIWGNKMIAQIIQQLSAQFCSS
jgi:hypothetical protein